MDNFSRVHQKYFSVMCMTIIQIGDTIETLREMVSSMMEVYLSSVSYRLNGVMKVLTIITTIFMPLSFIASIYGMNFEHMPELKSPWGYPAVLGVMALTGLAMLPSSSKRSGSESGDQSRTSTRSTK